MTFPMMGHTKNDPGKGTNDPEAIKHIGPRFFRPDEWRKYLDR